MEISSISQYQPTTSHNKDATNFMISPTQSVLLSNPHRFPLCLSQTHNYDIQPYARFMNDDALRIKHNKQGFSPNIL